LPSYCLPHLTEVHCARHSQRLLKAQALSSQKVDPS
jgi:hypothetical protein